MFIAKPEPTITDRRLVTLYQLPPWPLKEGQKFDSWELRVDCTGELIGGGNFPNEIELKIDPNAGDKVKDQIRDLCEEYHKKLVSEEIMYNTTEELAILGDIL